MKFRRIALAATLLVLSTAALAQRNVWVNGQRMGAGQLSQLDRAHCGFVPDGRYWLNLRSGVWGYWNNPRPQGHIATTARAVDPPAAAAPSSTAVRSAPT